jgi:hypothetical protein
MAVLAAIHSSGSAAPRPPLPPWPEVYLYQWSFDEPYTTPALAQRSSGKASEAPAWVESWSGYAINRSGGQIQPIQLPLKAENGYPMVASGMGTLRFWFNPQWSSGQGPGHEARLLDLITGKGKDSVTWWTLRVNADGTGLVVAAQTVKGLVDLAQAPIQWQAGKWHLVTVVYSPTNTVLSVDALAVAEGVGLPVIPAAVVALSSLVVGSNAQGLRVAQGQFEELTTFPYAYPDLLLGVYYRSHRRQADLGPIGFIATERNQTVAALELEPPGGGGGGGDTSAGSMQCFPCLESR